MASYTQNLNLEKPLGSDNFRRAVINDNMDKIDAAVAVAQGGIEAHLAEDASETQKGHVELATAAETTAGTDNTRAVHPAGLKVELDKKISLTGGTFTGIVTAQNNTSYTTKQVRNIIESTGDPTGGSNGDIWIKYS